MKRAYYLPIALVIVAIAFSMPSLAAPQSVTVRGEVIDSVCFIKMGSRGADHRDCAQTCADNGIPLAMLVEGTDEFVWLASNQSMQSPNADLKAHAGHTVELVGDYVERGGVKIFVIEEIKHISAGN